MNKKTNDQGKTILFWIRHVFMKSWLKIARPGGRQDTEEECHALITSWNEQKGDFFTIKITKL